MPIDEEMKDSAVTEVVIDERIQDSDNELKEIMKRMKFSFVGSSLPQKDQK